MTKATEPSQEGPRLYKRQKKLLFCPTTPRLEAFGTMRADFLSAESKEMARGFLHNQGTVVNEILVLEQARPFSRRVRSLWRR
jgi:hypothetical protein